MAFDPLQKLREELAAAGRTPEEIAAWENDPSWKGNGVAWDNTFLAGVIDPFESGSEEREASAAGAKGTQTLEDLRGMIPNSQRTLFEIQDDPRIVAANEALQRGEISWEEAAAIQDSVRNSVSYDEIDPSQYSNPQAIGVSDQLQGYDASLIDDAAFNRLGMGADRARYGQVQRDAVDSVFGIAKEGGLTAIDRARIAEQRAGEDQWLRGQRGAQMANLQARGLQGSGSELASAFDMQQSSANRNAQRGVQIEALAQQRQDQALRDAFGMSGEARRDQNSLAQWNSQMTTDAARYRADVNNQGAISDVNDRRGVRDYTAGRDDATVRENTNIRNAGQDATRGETWNRFNANAGISGTQAGQSYGMQGALMQQGQMDSGRLIQGLGGLAGSFGAGGAFGQGGAFGGGGGQKLTEYKPPQVQSQYKSPSEDELIDPWEV